MENQSSNTKFLPTILCAVKIYSSKCLSQVSSSVAQTSLWKCNQKADEEKTPPPKKQQQQKKTGHCSESLRKIKWKGKKTKKYLSCSGWLFPLCSWPWQVSKKMDGWTVNFSSRYYVNPIFVLFQNDLYISQVQSWSRPLRSSNCSSHANVILNAVSSISYALHY